MLRKRLLYVAVLALVLGTVGCTMIDTLLYGPAIHFSSAEAGYGQVPYNPSLSFGGAVTVEAWVRLNSYVGWASFITKGSTTGEYSLRLDDVGAGHLRFTINDQGAIEICDSNGILSLGNWHHVAATYDGTTIRLFIDGQPDGMVATTTPVTTNTEDLYLGFDSPGAAEYLDGDIAEARVWSIARTPAEILGSMNKRLVGTESGLVLLCPLNEGSGSTFAEKVHGTSGTLKGGYEWVGGPSSLH